MSTPDSPPRARRWGASGLLRLAESFAGQEHVDIFGGLLLRLARYLGGDPSLFVQVTSANTTTPVGLPDNTPAQSAVLHVQGNPIAYRVDGGIPNAGTDAVIQVGAIVTLTGPPTLKAFQFVSTAATPATLTGEFYD